jgi:DNA-binding cell septation regulator SpoVG
MKRIGRMPAAIPPERIKNISGVQSALEANAKNVKLNLETAQFDVTNAKGSVVKSISVNKGHDSVYVINYSKKPDDFLAASHLINTQMTESIGKSSLFETQFAELQDDMLRSVQTWRSSAPGANKTSISLEIGRQQRELATIERKLRESQYSYREALTVQGLKRRLYDPSSNDDRVIPFEVARLSQTTNLSKNRVMPVLE